MQHIVLASQSPRRSELLSRMGIVFDVVPSQFEEWLDDTLPPEKVAIALATGKTQEVAEQFPDSVVIGSDTIVVINGQQLGKPQNDEEAFTMLQQLSGAMHEVLTSVVIAKKVDKVLLKKLDTTRVYFKPFDKDAVNAYIATKDSFDKAGGYGIQSGAADLIDHIEGHYDTVVGLPTHLLATMFNEIGVDAHPAILDSPVRQILN